MLKLELPDSITHVVKNTTDELTINVGKTLGDIWYLIFSGISYAADKRRAKYIHNLSVYKQEISASIDKIPADKRIEPSLQITAQALENSKYCIEEKELRDMFTALISNSMNSDFSQDIHPSFAEIIKQMSVLDAQILKIIKNAPIQSVPICNYRVSSADKEGYSIIQENVFLGLPDVSLESCSTSISSLERLGLLQIPPDIYLNPEGCYDMFKQHPSFLFLQKKYSNGKPSIEKKVARLTPLGQLCAKICIPD